MGKRVLLAHSLLEEKSERSKVRAAPCLVIFMPKRSGSSPRTQLSPASLMKASSPLRYILPAYARARVRNQEKIKAKWLVTFAFEL